MRADRTARTEVSRAQGFADVEAWTRSGILSGKAMTDTVVIFEDRNVEVIAIGIPG